MEWISVKDRLPNCDGAYITFNARGWGANTTMIGNYEEGSEPYGYMIRRYYAKKKIFTSEFGNKNVTHWMPLPEPPLPIN